MPRIGIDLGGISITQGKNGMSMTVRKGGYRVTKGAKGTGVSVKQGNRRITKTASGKTYITTYMGGGTSMRQRVN